MKEDKQWDDWNRSTLATAYSHACENIFTDYVPRTDEAKELFFEQQKFIYSVFESCLKTSMGRYCVHKLQHTFDTQAIYKEMVTYANDSTQATLDTDELLNYIATNKLHTSN